MSSNQLVPPMPPHYPTFTSSLLGSASPLVTNNGPGDLPPASRPGGTFNTQTPQTVTASIFLKPSRHGYEKKIAPGMPLFINSKHTVRSNDYVGASPAILNYYFSQGANVLQRIKRTVANYNNEELRKYDETAQLHCNGDPQEAHENWKFYGVVESLTSHNVDSERQIGHTCALARIGKDARVLNYWGDVSEGAHIGFAMVSRPASDSLTYLPDGTYVPSAGSHGFDVLKIIPVVCEKDGTSPRRMTNPTDLTDFGDQDIDYMLSTPEKTQKNATFDPVTGNIIVTPLDLQTEVLKVETLDGFKLHRFGYYIPVGIVRKCPVKPPTKTLVNVSMTSDVSAKELGMISIYML